MNHIVPRTLVALLTFSVGLFLHAACRESSQPVSVSNVPIPASEESPTTFQGTGVIDMFMETYRRASDGETLRFGCSDRASAAKALSFVRPPKRDARLVEKTDVYDANGTKIGERVVWDSRPGSEAEVTWNENARLFYINAPSLQDALTFEKSKVWRDSGCWDFRSL